ncbi:putative cell division control protein 14 [Rosellinia necatrix]|uniref:Putative cell division control protein 14 n=1 Tax=Rosellinia necatrix TaxID=77044 RepID=A0A1W2TW19_ROSNE|nr:putative cell division control protein 14 [Rosellinia necatrix]
MESLLSLAFDNLSSYDGGKIRKGLRQVEGLLANICLSRQQTSKVRRASVATDSGQEQESPPESKSLSELTNDPAFYEFFKLQEGFEWNVAVRLVNTLDRLLAKGGDGSNDLLILNALDLIQGVMLLHPPSKALFSREMYMNLLLDLIEPDFCPAIQSATLLTLVTALIDTPQNTRTFEGLDGLLAVTSLFRSRSTNRDVKRKLIEFIYFYLMPETPSIPSASPHDALPGLLQRSPSKLAKAFSASPGGAKDESGRPRSAGEAATRTQEEKQALLGRHLHSVEELVKDLRQNNLFNGAVS